jgi:hypothetical protein
MTYKTPKTKRGAIRQRDSIISAYKRTYAGGGAFGYDWPTFRVQAPDAYAHLKHMQTLFASLPE